jgi:hypothetical protein
MRKRAIVAVMPCLFFSDAAYAVLVERTRTRATGEGVKEKKEQCPPRG